jgi:putative membrane protein
MATEKKAGKPAKKEKVLIISVDRDDDLGNKAKVRGPVVGREAVLRAAEALGLADAEESDFNAMFQAVRFYDDMRKQYEVEVAILTGHDNVGLQSDREINRQLVSVLAKFPADYAIMVTDGTEDEHVMPIIQSRVPILSVRRVIVKQSEELESTYYKIKDFISESMENPKFARLVFGLPAVALLLYALFGIDGWRIIVGAVGAYMFIKGFKLEKYVYNLAEELKTSLERRKPALFLYIIGIIVAIFATYKGYTGGIGLIGVGLFEAASAFLNSSVYYYLIAVASVWIGRNYSHRTLQFRGTVAFVLFGVAVSMLIYNAAELVLVPDLSFVNFAISIAVGFVILGIALAVELRK